MRGLSYMKDIGTMSANFAYFCTLHRLVHLANHAYFQIQAVYHSIYNLWFSKLWPTPLHCKKIRLQLNDNDRLHVNIQLAQFQITTWDLHLHRVKKINSFFFKTWLTSSTVKPRVLKFLPNYPKKHQLLFNQISNQARNTLAAAAVNDQMPDLTVFLLQVLILYTVNNANQ